MTHLYALASGAPFGLGLVLSDMTSPARMLAFLDVAESAARCRSGCF
jgi:uncharacterized membrane protein YedE/YeeE